MFLAEDRILCLKIYANPNKAYMLKYLPTAHAVVDPVTSLLVLMGQRKRWMNGTWFALDYVLRHRHLAKESLHSKSELIMFSFSMYYAQFSQILGYYSISIYFAVLYMTLQGFFSQNEFFFAGSYMNDAL